MLFNSIEFLIFLPVVVFLFYIIPNKFRWILLLAASYYFYMCWKPEYIILIIASTLIDYFVALGIARRKNKRAKRKLLIISLMSNLGILFGFKYFNFFSTSVHLLFNKFNVFYDLPLFDVLLPVGISFYTFQTLSYTIDVYKGKIKPTGHLGKFALFVSFFPQLVAGPIERSVNLLPQFYKKITLEYSNIIIGLRRILWGMFKKVVIADRLAIFVNQVYDSPHDSNGLQLAIATIFFAFQIYCDFSGYSDIAIGAAKTLGFDLMENFKTPYFSKSISEFWKRWHISLSSWFKDYLYIPLGGNRVVKWRWYYNLIVTFVVSGLWHGANWTFIAWGLLHGIYLILSIILAKIPLTGKIFDYSKRNAISIFFTFFLVCFAWIFFRANSISDAFLIVKNLFDYSSVDIGIMTINELLLSFFFIAILLILDIKTKLENISVMLDRTNKILRWGLYLLFIFGILYFGKYNVQEFIYFQF